MNHKNCYYFVKKFFYFVKNILISRIMENYIKSYTRQFSFSQ